jgi:hypothetical protein
MSGLIDEALEAYEWCIDSAIESARESGMDVVRSTEDRILLDLDDGASLDRYRKMLLKLRDVFDLKEVERWKSKSGVGVHVVISCRALPFVSRIAIAACLGSDPMREGLAVAMARDGKEEPSVLFRPRVAQPAK